MCRTVWSLTPGTILYLHARILEDQGVDAVSPDHGRRCQRNGAQPSSGGTPIWSPWPSGT